MDALCLSLIIFSYHLLSLRHSLDCLAKTFLLCYVPRLSKLCVMRGWVSTDERQTRTVATFHIATKPSWRPNTWAFLEPSKYTHTRSHDSRANCIHIRTHTCACERTRGCVWVCTYVCVSLWLCFKCLYKRLLMRAGPRDCQHGVAWRSSSTSWPDHPAQWSQWCG